MFIIIIVYANHDKNSTVSVNPPGTAPDTAFVQKSHAAVVGLYG